ncbi:MAG: DNA methyltransferase [Acutalibacteraceae bacterium]|nr:DNA methyltransferase [Acutalibacteraceae bacterium]
MDIKNIAVKDLIPYEKNTKKHDDVQINNVAESIKQYGFVQPIVIDKNNVVVIGHCRLLAAKKLKMADVPCVCVEDLTEEQVKALRIVDNKSNESPWDFDFLADELADLDFSDFNFDFGIDTDADEETEIVEDEAPEVDEENEPITKLGDIWQLGRHRLMCGDSTDKATVELLMNGNKADMVFTDPPYGMKKEADGVANDNLNFDDLFEFNKRWIPITFEALKDNGSWYCWGIDEPLMDIYSHILKPMAKENKITFRNFITWDKGNGQGQMSEKHTSYAVASEKCLFVSCGKTVLHINSWQKKFDERFRPLLQYLQEQKKLCGWDTAQLKTIAGCKGMVADHWTTTDQWRVPPEDVYLKWANWAKENGIKAFLRPHKELVEEQDKIKKEYEKERTYFDNCHDNMNDVWHFERTSSVERELCGEHATPKPIALCSRAIKSSSREGEIVLDVFGGSGSTLIACEQLNRSACLCELEPKWCDVIIKRWETLTGEKAVLING